MTKRYILNERQEALYRSSSGRIAPSKVHERHWEGQWNEGSTFSIGQLYELKVMGFDPETVDRMDVIAAGEPGRIYITTEWGLSYRQVDYFYRRLACPIVGKKGERLLVITPAGHKKLVYPNGELTRLRNRRAA